MDYEEFTKNFCLFFSANNTVFKPAAYLLWKQVFYNSTVACMVLWEIPYGNNTFYLHYCCCKYSVK